MRGRTEREVDGDLELPGIDETIREQLLWALISDPHIDASSIDVSVREGTVALTGVVVSGAVTPNYRKGPHGTLENPRPFGRHRL